MIANIRRAMRGLGADAVLLTAEPAVCGRFPFDRGRGLYFGKTRGIFHRFPLH